MEKNLTPRQWKLYELLKGNSDLWMTQQEIYNILKDDYKGVEVGVNFHDSMARINITNDIQQINQSQVIQKIILSTGNGIKIANEEEYRTYSINKWKSLKRMISRLAWKDHKAKLDGQMKLIFGDSMARDYYETFVKEYEGE